ncbi:MAG: S8 family serine peptidase, partial [Pseudomonadota bacterium]
REVMNVDEVQGIDLGTTPPTYRGTIGRGVKVAVVDCGVDATHPDLHLFDSNGIDQGTRVVGKPPLGDDQHHGTTISGTIAGNGHNSDKEPVPDLDRQGTPYQWRGIAPGVEKIVSIHYGGIPSLVELAKVGGQEHNTYLSNHSYAASPGNYTELVKVVDELVYDGVQGFGDPKRPPRVIVFAVANSGQGATFAHLGMPAMGYYSILAPSKNAIGVGGINGNDLTYFPDSSKGPTFDGRIKPDLVAIGWYNYRPPDGVVMEIKEIRLVAKQGTTAVDRVWNFTEDDDFKGWFAKDGLLDAQVKGGVLKATSQLHGKSGCLVFDAINTDGASFSAENYEAVELTMRLNMVEVPGKYRWPRFWVASWDKNGDQKWDGEIYPKLDPKKRITGTWQTHRAALDASNWEGDIQFFRVWPVVYDDRIVVLKIGGGYHGGGATSVAAPMVAGVVALMMERLSVVHGIDFETAPLYPSTIKALLIHTAKDLVHSTPLARDPDNTDTGAPAIYHEGPDFVTGYGLVDAKEVLGLIDDHLDTQKKWREEVIKEGEIHEYQIPIDTHSAQGGPLKITVVWDDPPGTPDLGVTESTLVNDLDIVLVGPEKQAYSPWVLKPLPCDEKTIMDGLDPIKPEDIKPAQRCIENQYWTKSTTSCEDHLNNVEQIVVDQPQAGKYTLRIRAYSLPQSPQRYSLVVSQSCSL